MNNLAKKTIVINLLILVVYTLLVNLNFTSGSERALGVIICMAFLIGIHVIINFFISIIAFIKKDKLKGKVYLLNCGIILLVGFSSCWGTSSI